MKHTFSIKRNGYDVKRGPLKKHKIIPLNLILKVEKQYLKALPPNKGQSERKVLIFLPSDNTTSAKPG